MTCNDCIHSGICAIQLEPHYVLDRTQKLMRESNNVEHECLSFKDRSRFVELPCKVGDTVYRIKGDTVRKERVLRIEICTSGIILVNMNGYHIGYGDTIGKHIFLTRKEAEQALKERETE